MHSNSYKLMKHLLTYGDESKPLTVLDVGSQALYNSRRERFDYSYRQLMPDGWTYSGADISKGHNVDYIIEPYAFGFEDNAFDVVISGQCLEHVEQPWTWFAELVRVSSNLIIVIAPWSWRQHRYPLDCWRILPDGFRALAAIHGLEVVECGRRGRDCFMCAKKKAQGDISL